MPGPFPGMDPYLEDPDHWPGVQMGIISSLWAMLNSLLPPSYIAAMEECVCDPLPEESMADREIYLDIRPARERRVVTTIEVVSHADKSQGSPWRELYKTKQRQNLQSAIHLIEIDLLRWGAHTIVAPLKPLSDCKHPWNYLVCLHRSNRRGEFEFWLPTVRERLPRISVPLENDLPDVVLDIQAAFDRNYDAGAYDREIDYRHDPVPPLSAEDAAWADLLLREQGLRHAEEGA